MLSHWKVTFYKISWVFWFESCFRGTTGKKNSNQDVLGLGRNCGYTRASSECVASPISVAPCHGYVLSWSIIKKNINFGCLRTSGIWGILQRILCHLQVVYICQSQHSTSLKFSVSSQLLFPHFKAISGTCSFWTPGIHPPRWTYLLTWVEAPQVVICAYTKPHSCLKKKL